MKILLKNKTLTVLLFINTLLGLLNLSEGRTLIGILNILVSVIAFVVMIYASNKSNS